MAEPILSGQSLEPLSAKDSLFASRRRRWRWFWRGTGFIIGGSLGFSLGAGWWFQHRLSPLIAQGLTHFLNRPVQLGDLQYFSLTYLRFGESAIAPTAQDPDRVRMRSLEVRYNPLTYLFNRKLRVEVTAINPDIFLEQAKAGEWLRTPLHPLDPNHPIDLGQLRLRQATVTVITRSHQGTIHPAVKLNASQANAHFDWKHHQIRFDLRGNFAQGDRIALSGVTQFQTHDLKLQLQGKNLPAQTVSHLLPLPFQIAQGRLDSQLNLDWQGSQAPRWTGTVDLRGVNAEFRQLPRPLTQIAGLLRFQGNRIDFEQVKATYGTISGTVQGSLYPAQGFLLKAEIPETAMQSWVTSLKLPLTVPVQGSLHSRLTLTGTFARPLLTAQISTTRSSQIDRLSFRALQAQLALQDSRLSVRQIQAIPVTGGTLIGQGKIDFRNQRSQYAFDFQTQQLAIAALRPYHPDLPLANSLTSQGQITGDFKQPRLLQMTASGQLALTQGAIAIDRWQLNDQRWQGEFRSQNLPLITVLPDLPKTLAGNWDGQWRLAGDLSGNPETLIGTGAGRLSLPQGLITTQQLQIAQGRWSGQFGTRDLRLQPFLAAAQASDRLTGNLTLGGRLDRPQQTLIGKGSAALTLNQGVLTLPRLAFNGDQVQATLLAQGIGLRPFSERLRGKVSGRVDLTASLAHGQFDRLESEGTIALSEGVGALTRPLTTRFAWKNDRLQLLNLTAPNLVAQGWIDFAGDRFLQRQALQLQALQMKGFNLALQTQDFPIRDLPLPTTIPLQQTTGKLDFKGTIAGTPQRPQINGDLVLTQLRSPLLPVTLESVLQGQVQSDQNQRLALTLAGKQDKIAFTLAPRSQLIELDLRLAQLQVRGRQQQSQFLIEADRVPLPLLQAIAQVNPSLTQALPTALRQALLDPTLRGDLAGRFWLNSQARSLIGEDIAILNPGWGTLRGDRLTGSFQYRNGLFTLPSAQFQVNQSRYLLSASLTPQADGLHGQGEIAVAQGNIQDILTALQIYDLDDLKRGKTPPRYAKAAALYGATASSSQSPSPHTNQPLPALYAVGSSISGGNFLSYFSEQLRRLEQQRQQRRQSTTLPPLRELRGTLDGSLKLTFSPQGGLATIFSLQGQNWQWGAYPTLQLFAQGTFRDGILAFDPFTLQLGNPQSQQNQIHFVGQIGPQGQAGQIQILNLSLQEIAKAIALPYPLDVGGWLNGALTFGGNRQNPQATGQWGIERATLNQRDLPPLKGEFTYRNSRVDFFAKGAAPFLRREPLTLSGTFPLRLPTTTLIPASDRWQAQLQMQDEDLRLFNIFTGKQLDWISGQGNLWLEAQGRIDSQTGLASELQVQGLTQFKQATLASSLILAPLTNVQGQISLNLDRIRVENLTGQLSGGNFRLQGSLPLQPAIAQSQSSSQSQSQFQPLQLTFNDLLLNLPGLYQGKVRGDIQGLGSVLAPTIGGQIELFNGQVLLGDLLKEPVPSDPTRSLPELTNLKLILGDNILITRPPIVTVWATGDLLLNGSLDQPRPEGTILLKNGQVNLFASQLRLAGGESNTVQFSPQWGFDPYLNLRLITAVSETNRRAVRSTPLSSEINDPFTANNDSLQTVRIQAQVKGLASQLARNIDLTSNPPRNRSEIITLLGGSFVNTLSSGDTTDTTVGLANLAGTAVFGPVQGAIGDALGLSEFRIFSTPLINNNERIGSTQIGVAAEAGVDVTHDLSLSILQILNGDRPPQFGLRYRINGNTTLRGSSNFSDDNRGILEYERRF